MTVFSRHNNPLVSAAIALLCLIVALPVQAIDLPVTLAPDTLEASSVPVRESNRHRRTQVQLPADGKKKKADAPTVPTVSVVNVAGDTITLAATDSIAGLEGVEILAAVNQDSIDAAALGKKRIFNPNPSTALWMSALCPGAGQIYNRRYWKLPIVVGAFVGLSYGMSWNNRMFNDYSRAYRDAMDDDPETRSYMNFYPPNVKESDLDMAWLQKALKNKRTYYRRYRDICILSMVAVYALSILDAYVDASLAHFDISPDLSMKVAPTVIPSQYVSTATKPSLGMRCAINF